LGERGEGKAGVDHRFRANHWRFQPDGQLSGRNQDASDLAPDLPARAPGLAGSGHRQKTHTTSLP